MKGNYKPIIMQFSGSDGTEGRTLMLLENVHETSQQRALFIFPSDHITGIENLIVWNAAMGLTGIPFENKINTYELVHVCKQRPNYSSFAYQSTGRKKSNNKQVCNGEL